MPDRIPVKINVPAAVVFVAVVVCMLAALRFAPEQKELIAILGATIAALGPAVIERKPPAPPSDGTGEGPKTPNLTLISGGALMLLGACVVGCAAALSGGSYGAQLEMCVSSAKTLAQSQECRCRVNLSEGRPCTPVPSHCTQSGSALTCADAGAQ